MGVNLNRVDSKRTTRSSMNPGLIESGRSPSAEKLSTKFNERCSVIRANRSARLPLLHFWLPLPLINSLIREKIIKNYLPVSPFSSIVGRRVFLSRGSLDSPLMRRRVICHGYSTAASAAAAAVSSAHV